MKKKKLCQQTPIVIDSTSNNDNERKKCLKLGAKAFVSKGVSDDSVMIFATNIDHFLQYPHEALLYKRRNHSGISQLKIYLTSGII